MRYEGTDCALMVTPKTKSSENNPKHGDFSSTFLERYLFIFFVLLKQFNIKTIQLKDKSVADIKPNLDSQCIEKFLSMTFEFEE